MSNVYNNIPLVQFINTIRSMDKLCFPIMTIELIKRNSSV